MRLLKWTASGPSFTKNLLPHESIPPYAILSHRWGADEDEVTHKDVLEGVGKGKAGYRKLEFCASQAQRDNLQHFWVDTCCIDKTNMVELQESITSMFRWYKESARCYVYMADIRTSDYTDDQHFEREWESVFRANAWFTRGWTLQELVAPSSVAFFTGDGRRMGDKNTLQQTIYDITSIPMSVLQGTNESSSFDVEERFRWAEKRMTTREEDWAYSLLGIFGVSMTIIYGEGKDNAIRRLKASVAESGQRDDTLRTRESRKWLVPFERNTCFTGRTSELEAVRRLLFAKDHTAKLAVTGLGGIGKTQLVVELLYLLRDEYKDCSFLWISSSSEESMSQAYHQAARALDIAGWDNKAADMKQLVQAHLSNKENGRWVLVFDNADDFEMWSDGPKLPGANSTNSRRLADYLPKGDHLSILFTTRDKKLAVKLVGANCLVEIEAVNEADGKELLRKYLHDADLVDDHEDDAVALLEWLACLPLAIVQASTYVSQNSSDLRTYLSLLNEQEQDAVELLSEDFEDHGRYADGKNPIATTWLISFEQIRKRDPLAADYLSMMACVEAKDIPRFLLPPGASRKKESDAIGTLRGYSFISENRENATFSAHRLVHLAMRNWLRKEGQFPNWCLEARRRLAELLELAQEHNMESWRPFIPHAAYALTANGISDNNAPYTTLLWFYGLCLAYDGRYWEAEAALLQATLNLVAVCEPDNILLMNIAANLGSVASNLGRLDEAEELLLVALGGQKTHYGVEHPTTLNTMCILASVLHQQGRLDEAETLQLQAVELRSKILGPNNANTLTSMDILAQTLLQQGKLGEAEALQLHVLQTRKTVFGAGHTSTLLSMSHLACNYCSQGRLEAAETMQLQVRDALQVMMGSDYRGLLICKSDLALTWACQGRHKEAMDLMQDCARRGEKIMGAEHPYTVRCLEVLAMLRDIS